MINILGGNLEFIQRKNGSRKKKKYKTPLNLVFFFSFFN